MLHKRELLGQGPFQDKWGLFYAVISTKMVRFLGDRVLIIKTLQLFLLVLNLFEKPPISIFMLARYPFRLDTFPFLLSGSYEPSSSFLGDFN